MFQFVNKVDHIFAHRRSMNAIYKSTVFKSWILSFHFFHNLFPKRTYFGGACDRHVLVAFISIVALLLINKLAIGNDEKYHNEKGITYWLVTP